MGIPVLPPTGPLPLSAQQVVKAGFHDVVWHQLFTMTVTIYYVRLTANAKAFAQRRTGPSHTARAGQHGILKRREITDANKEGAFFNRFGHFLVLDAAQNARQTIATA